MTTVLFDNLEISQYRAFDYLKIERLGLVNLFLGKNNVGKSTLLEALYLNANVGAPPIIQSILCNRDEVNNTSGSKAELAIAIPI